MNSTPDAALLGSASATHRHNFNRERAQTADAMYTQRERVWVSLLRAEQESAAADARNKKTRRGGRGSRASPAASAAESGATTASGGGGGDGGVGQYGATKYYSGMTDDDHETEGDTDGDNEADLHDDVVQAEPQRESNHIDPDSGAEGDDDNDGDDANLLLDEEHGPAGGHGGHAAPKLKYLNKVGEIAETHNPLYFDSAVEMLEEQRYHSTNYSQRRCARWVLLFVVAFGVGVSAFMVTWITRLLNYVRFDLIMDPIAADNELWLAYIWCAARR
jgi:hypothetical protein